MIQAWVLVHCEKDGSPSMRMDEVCQGSVSPEEYEKGIHGDEHGNVHIYSLRFGKESPPDYPCFWGQPNQWVRVDLTPTKNPPDVGLEQRVERLEFLVAGVHSKTRRG